MIRGASWIGQNRSMAIGGNHRRLRAPKRARSNRSRSNVSMAGFSFRPDQAFGKAILPRCPWCNRLVPDAHGPQSACNDAAIDPIPIADEVARSLFPRKCFGYLTCNPFRRRSCCDVDPDEPSAAQPDDDKGIEQVEIDRWNHEQVHGGDVWRVVMREGPPSLAGRPSPLDHVLGNARLCDLKPKLEQFRRRRWLRSTMCSAPLATPVRSARRLPERSTAAAWNRADP